MFGIGIPELLMLCGLTAVVGGLYLFYRLMKGAVLREIKKEIQPNKQTESENNGGL